MSLDAMATKGESKLNAKVGSMQTSYGASASRAQTNYDALPFGPTRKSNYRSAWSFAPSNYSAKVTAGIGAKWRRNWTAKMSE